MTDLHYLFGLGPVALVLENEVGVVEEEGVLHFLSRNIFQIVARKHLDDFILRSKPEYFLDLWPKFSGEYLDEIALRLRNDPHTKCIYVWPGHTGLATKGGVTDVGPTNLGLTPRLRIPQPIMISA